MDKITHKYGIEGLVPVASLNGVVGSPSLFIRYLICWTGKIVSVVYINEKWINSSKTSACTVRECAIVRNVLHVTLTCQFISWCSGAVNVKWTPWVWHSSLKFIEVNCDPESAEMFLMSHHLNYSIFQIWIVTYLVYPSIFLWKLSPMPQFFGILELVSTIKK